MSLPETGYGFTVSAKLFGISVNRIVSNSYNCHKIFIRGHSQVEKPCKIIIIILILSPENRYMTHSSAGKLFDEGSNVDIMEGRGTVEPDGESSCASDLLRDEQHMDGFGSVSITKFRCFLNNELVKVFS